MKFINNIVLALSFGSVAFAAPLELEKKQLGAVATSPTVIAIDSAITTLQAAIVADTAAINTALVAAKGSVTASAQVIAALGVNYNAIVTALQAAQAAITAATTGAVGGVAGTVTGLTAADIALLIKDIQTAEALIRGIGATLTVTVTNLGPAATVAITSELAAVQAALAPFAAPLTVFAAAAAAASATATLTVTGVNAAITGLIGLIGSTLAAL